MDEIRTSTATERQQTNLATSRDDRECSLDALHVLELHAGSGAPGRENEWLTGVRAAVELLQQALDQQQRNATEQSLLSAVERDAPRLRRRVQKLRQRYRSVHQELTMLRTQLNRTDQTEMIHVIDVRQKLDRLANELRYQRAREADIVYEAYSVDLGEGD